MVEEASMALGARLVAGMGGPCVVGPLILTDLVARAGAGQRAGVWPVSVLTYADVRRGDRRALVCHQRACLMTNYLSLQDIFKACGKLQHSSPKLFSSGLPWASATYSQRMERVLSC